MKGKPITEQQRKRYDEIRRFIKTYRLNDGLSQREFAVMAEIHFQTIKNLDAGKQVSVLTLFNCIDAMNLSLSEFFEDMD
jgi:transcriptional regulator with XRE-family HTH domain